MPTALVDVIISIFNHVYEASYLRYFRAVHGGAFWNGGEVWALWSDIYLETFSFVTFDLNLIFSLSLSAPWALKTRFGERGRRMCWVSFSTSIYESPFKARGDEKVITQWT